MSKYHREILSFLLGAGILAISLMVLHRFIPSLLWGAVLAMITFPFYQKWLKTCQSTLVASFTFTFFISVAFVIPLLWLLSILVNEAQLFINYLITLNQKGMPLPKVLEGLPVIGSELEVFWTEHFLMPGGLKSTLSQLNISLTPISYYAKEIGVSLFHRSVQFGFTMLSLFFFFRDGESWLRQLNKVGANCLGEMLWSSYATRLPSTLRATVNGTVLVGICVGVIMGVCYHLLDFPAPTLAAFFTGVAAMIPSGA